MVFAEDYWFAKLLFQKGLALVYLIAFTAALRQFRPLLGENGITPFKEFVQRADFRRSPSLFHVSRLAGRFESRRLNSLVNWFSSDQAFKSVSALGITVSALLLSLPPGYLSTPAAMVLWLTLWIYYLSIVNVGQVWYGYGWESKLLEAGFLAVFLGNFQVEASIVIIFLIRWMLFRVMFGAGLIKLRGDDCWRDLTALNYHYLTQPMPNPLSWFLHKLPEGWHRFETLATHFTQLVVPLLYFAPQPFTAIAGIITIIFHLALMLGGNYSWLNLISIVLAFSLIPDSILSQLIPLTKNTGPIVSPHRFLIYAYALVAIALSYYPVRNMISSSQVMNTSFDPLHLVNTYGAFGSITKTRYEVAIEGRNEGGEWKEYEFPGKPTDTGKMPPQIAPYHLRLDWQLWFAAMTPRPRRRWFQRFMYKLKRGDDDIDRLISENPFPDGPDHIRARRYRYEFTDWEALREDGEWWQREEVGTYFPETGET
jgi:hypothetical protein